MSDIAKKLNESIPRECISEKQGLSYVSHRYVKNRLNEVFGWDGWEYTVEDVKLDRENMGCFVHVRLEVYISERKEHGWGSSMSRDGLAYGFAAGQTSNQAFDFAIAEAVTDALKRAAVSLGNSMGLELYPMTKGGKAAPKKKKTTVKEEW
jgi:recombination DNA repair RAD52 pathway protein